MQQINVGIIGTGWCGGIRANTCAGSPLVKELHIAEINEDRLKEIVAETKPNSSTTDYMEIRIIQWQKKHCLLENMCS